MKIKGLKKAAGVTQGCSYRMGGRVQISLDTETGRVYTDYHVGQTWSVYRDPAIITVCFADGPMTMVEIAESIKRALYYRGLEV